MSDQTDEKLPADFLKRFAAPSNTSKETESDAESNALPPELAEKWRQMSKADIEYVLSQPKPADKNPLEKDNANNE